MTRGPAVLLVVGFAVVGIAACGVPTQTHPTQLEQDGVQVVEPASSTSLPPGIPTKHADLCVVSRDHLVRRVVELPTPLSARRTLQALVDAHTTGLPNGQRSAINFSNLATARPTVRGVAQVELDADFAKIPPGDQILALAQIVCTLTSLPGVGQVRFTQNGRGIDIPRGDGSLTNRPVARFDYKRLLPTS